MPKRPEILPSKTHRKETNCGGLYVTVAFWNDKPYEVQILMGKGGQCAFAFCEAISNVVTRGLQKGHSMEELIKCFADISCGNPVDDVKSCADGVAQVLSEYIEKKEEVAT